MSDIANLNQLGAIYSQHLEDLDKATDFTIDTKVDVGDEPKADISYSNKSFSFDFVFPKSKDGKDGEPGKDGKDGEDGKTPMIMIIDNFWKYSWDEGKTWSEMSTNPVFYQFKEENNRIRISQNMGSSWEDISGPISAYFRFSSNGDNSLGKFQMSRDQNTWTDLSKEFVSKLHISKYIDEGEDLPSNPMIGDIVLKRSGEVYTMWIYLEKGEDVQWFDCGQYNSFTAGIDQTLTDSPATVPSSKVVNDEITKLKKTSRYFYIGGQNMTYTYKKVSGLVPGKPYKIHILNKSDWTTERIDRSSSENLFDITYLGTSDKVLAYGKINESLNALNGKVDDMGSMRDSYIITIPEENGDLRIGIRADAGCNIYFNITDHDNSSMTQIDYYGKKDESNESMEFGKSINSITGSKIDATDYTLYGPIWVRDCLSVDYESLLFNTNNSNATEGIEASGVAWFDENMEFIGGDKAGWREGMDDISYTRKMIQVPDGACWAYAPARIKYLGAFRFDVTGQSMNDKMKSLMLRIANLEEKIGS